MKWELMVVALFWLVYGPASFVIWDYTSSHLGSLVAILMAGIVFTAAFLGGRLLMQYFRAKRKEELVKEIENLSQLEQEETEPEADSEETEEVLEEKASAPLVQESLD